MILMRDTMAACSAALRFEHVAQHAVDAEADHRAGFEGFDMDVRGAFAQGLGEHGVDQADDGRVVFHFEQVCDVGRSCTSCCKSTSCERSSMSCAAWLSLRE